ncbi:MAG: sigma 54-interacting transcriptional regulator [Candidatus Binataceae bacterium]|nr:sigma 54-interacting transcriptional regulator [Candidatus Binataceae bacterium]
MINPRSGFWSRLRITPNSGTIWFDDQRIAMLSVRAFTELRRKLIEGIGPAESRVIFWSIGYSEGSKDAHLVRKLRPGLEASAAIADAIGLVEVAGFASGEVLRSTVDASRGQYQGEITWRDSVEASVQLELSGITVEPACWILTGHISGYVSGLIGRPIAFREVACRAMGNPACRAVGKLAEAWETPDEIAEVVHFPVTGNIETDASKPYQPIGCAPSFASTLHLIRKVAPTEAAVLLLGETGSGKEILARQIHGLSRRSGKPFIAVNCAAFPESLIEAELFGVEQGAYTGASYARPGRFERANGGTLFLDEVGALSLISQSKLLRALQESEIERVGATTVRKVNVRVIAATNANLRDAIQSGAFRRDLYFRLSTFPIEVPPLREREEDIPLLIEYFIRRYSWLHNKRVTGITTAATDMLARYDFPGNVRELEHMIERAIILVEDDHPIVLSHFASFGSSIMAENRSPVAGHPSENDSQRLLERLASAGVTVSEASSALIGAALRRAGDNVTEAARMLGMSRAQVAYWLKQQKVKPNGD